jgi:hypothetical protein
LAILRDDKKQIKEKIAAAREKNAAKVQELVKKQKDNPAEVSALICCFQIRNTDFCFCRLLMKSRKKLR